MKFLVKGYVIKLCALSLIVSLLILSSCDDPNISYTNDPADYSLLNDIPEDAQVVDYSYAELYDGRSDFYLELKFTTVQGFEQFLEKLMKEARDEKLDGEIYKDDTDLFLKTTNPYDSSFNEIVFLTNPRQRGYIYWVGYKDYCYSVNETIECCLSLISYSLEELIVIQTRIYGVFPEYIYDYRMPKYFERFNIVINEDCHRVYISNALKEYHESKRDKAY